MYHVKWMVLYHVLVIRWVAVMPGQGYEAGWCNTRSPCKVWGDAFTIMVVKQGGAMSRQGD